MKIVFLNVWGESMRDELPAYLKDLAQNTDVFCLQEATPEMKQACSDAFVGFTEYKDFKYLSDNDQFPQSTYVKKGIEVEQVETLFQGETDCGLALYTRLKTPEGVLHICNAHGSARPSEKLDTPGRLKYSQGLIDFFKPMEGPIIIGGDFNLELTTESVTLFEKNGYKNLIKDFSIDTTRNDLAWRYPVKLYYSDYVFLNDNVTVQSFEVPKNLISDHLPLILEVSY